MGWQINRLVSDLLEFSPRLYVAIQRYRYRKAKHMVEKRIVSESSEIMIEGYPRCANSFAVRAFRHANDRNKQMKIATHLHSPAHIALAVSYGVPTVVLIRHPDGAVLSKLAKLVEFGERGMEIARLTEDQIALLVSYHTSRYANFYNYLGSLAQKFVASDFEETTHDFGAVITRVNSMYKTKFKLFEHTEGNVKSIFEASGSHLSPSLEREEYKELFKAKYLSEGNAKNRQKALDAYEKFKKVNHVN